MMVWNFTPIFIFSTLRIFNVKMATFQGGEVRISLVRTLEYSETNFDLVASKIGAKLNNLIIYSDILVNFLRIFSKENQPYTKPNRQSQKFEIFFHKFQNIIHLLKQEYFQNSKNCGTKSTKSQKLKIAKIWKHNFSLVSELFDRQTQCGNFWEGRGLYAGTLFQ